MVVGVSFYLRTYEVRDGERGALSQGLRSEHANVSYRPKGTVVFVIDVLSDLYTNSKGRRRRALPYGVP